MITIVGAELGEGPHPRKGTHYGRNRGRGRTRGREHTAVGMLMMVMMMMMRVKNQLFFICGEWSPVLINNPLFVFTRGGWSLVPARKAVARQSPGLLLPLMLLFAVDVPRDG